MNGSRTAEPHDGPVVPRAAPTAGFPTIAHVRGSPGKDQVLAMAEEHVAAHDDPPSVLQRREIDVTAADECRPVRGNLSVDAQARHTAVRKDVEADVRDCGVTFDFDFVACVPLEGSFGDDLTPWRVANERVGGAYAVDAAAVERAMLRIVAAEEAGIDDDTMHDTRYAEPHDAPVVARRAAAARLPPVHPLATFGVLALAPFGRCRAKQMLLRSEELIVRHDRHAA